MIELSKDNKSISIGSSVGEFDGKSIQSLIEELVNGCHNSIGIQARTVLQQWLS